MCALAPLLLWACLVGLTRRWPDLVSAAQVLVELGMFYPHHIVLLTGTRVRIHTRLRTLAILLHLCLPWLTLRDTMRTLEKRRGV